MGWKYQDPIDQILAILARFALLFKERIDYGQISVLIVFLFLKFPFFVAVNLVYKLQKNVTTKIRESGVLSEDVGTLLNLVILMFFSDCLTKIQQQTSLATRIGTRQ